VSPAAGNLQMMSHNSLNYNLTLGYEPPIVGCANALGDEKMKIHVVL